MTGPFSSPFLYSEASIRDQMEAQYMHDTVNFKYILNIKYTTSKIIRTNEGGKIGAFD